jgi:hypothetical protein
MPISITPGSGLTVAADVYGLANPPSTGQQVQWVSIATGTVGSPAAVSSANPLPFSPVPQTTGGLLTYRNISLSTTGISIKASPGQIYGWFLSNSAGANRFIKIYDISTAPIVGTTTPVQTILIPPASAANVAFFPGITFVNGIGVGATVNVADSDTTAPSANDVIANFYYK